MIDTLISVFIAANIIAPAPQTLTTESAVSDNVTPVVQSVSVEELKPTLESSIETEPKQAVHTSSEQAPQNTSQTTEQKADKPKTTEPEQTAPKQAVQTQTTQTQETYSYEFLHRITARVIGEGSFAIPQIACTVRNRWREYHRAGLDAVLKAYYAQDVPPKPWQIEIVRKVFTGEIPCPSNWWYALSLQDTSYWTPHDRVAAIIVRSETSQIWIYER